MKILVTGSAGFIGYHLVKSLLINKNIKNNRILSIDNFDNYYDKKIKLEKIKNLNSKDFKFRINHKFKKIDLKDKNKLDIEIRKFKPDICHHFTIKPCIYGSIVARFTMVKTVMNAFTGLGQLYFMSQKK